LIGGQQIPVYDLEIIGQIKIEFYSVVAFFLFVRTKISSFSMSYLQISVGSAADELPVGVNGFLGFSISRDQPFGRIRLGKPELIGDFESFIR